MSVEGGPVELVGFVARALVSQPERVTVRAVDGGRVIELETAEEDRGRVIGRQGRVAKAMRALLAASGFDDDIRLDVVD